MEIIGTGGCCNRRMTKRYGLGASVLDTVIACGSQNMAPLEIVGAFYSWGEYAYACPPSDATEYAGIYAW